MIHLGSEGVLGLLNLDTPTQVTPPRVISSRPVSTRCLHSHLEGISAASAPQHSSTPHPRISHSSPHCLPTPSPPFSFDKNTCLDVSESRTMSGLKLFSTMFPGDLSRFPRSATSCQSVAVSKRPVQAFQSGRSSATTFSTRSSCDVLQSFLLLGARDMPEFR